MAFIMKRNDTRPIYKAQLTQTDPANPTAQIPVDLTTATSVRFLMKTSPTTGTPKVNALAVVTTPATGLVQYTWTGTDTDTAGTYFVEFEVHWGADLQTFPSDDYLTITIKEDLGP